MQKKDPTNAKELVSCSYLTNKVFPGARVVVTGIYDVFQKQGVSLHCTSLKTLTKRILFRNKPVRP